MLQVLGELGDDVVLHLLIALVAMRHQNRVLALERWLVISSIKNGAIFRPLTRHGGIGGNRLSGETVGVFVKKRVAGIRIDPTKYSGHSLRSGFATSAGQAGTSSWKIRAQTGHASDAMLSWYIREGELFSDNVAGHLL